MHLYFDLWLQHFRTLLIRRSAIPILFNLSLAPNHSKTTEFGKFGYDARNFRIINSERSIQVTPVGFEPTPFRNGALSHRLRPLGQSVVMIAGSYFDVSLLLLSRLQTLDLLKIMNVNRTRIRYSLAG